MLRSRRDVHCNASDHTDRRTVHGTQQTLLEHQRTAIAGLDLAKSNAAQRNRHRLTAGIAGLSRQHWQERGENDQPVDGALKHRHHTAGEKCGQQVQQQPRMTKLETLHHWCGDTLFFIHAHHATGLCRDLERLGFKNCLTSH